MKYHIKIITLAVLVLYSSVSYSMNKAEMIDAIADDTGLSKSDATAAYDSFVERIKNRLSAGEQVTLVGFGTFRVSSRSARVGRNPVSGESIQIPARKVANFKPGKNLMEALNSSSLKE